MLLDAGTGLRNLGTDFEPERATVLLTHTHWDHINGFPFFAPFYRPGHHFRVMAGHLGQAGGIKSILEGQMAGPMFPVPLDALRAEFEFEDFTANDQFALSSDVNIKTTTLNHPNGATGYRIEHGGKALCYVTDTEHVVGSLDQNILGLIDGADTVIYDSTYTDEEFKAHVGWGHSTWQQGVRLCEAANVKRFVIFHHDPSHDDSFMEKLELEAQATFPGAIAAREGMTLEI